MAFGSQTMYIVHRPRHDVFNYFLTTLVSPDEEALIRQGLKKDPQPGKIYTRLPDSVIDTIIQEYFLTQDISSPYNDIFLDGFVPLIFESQNEVYAENTGHSSRKERDTVELFDKNSGLALCYEVETPFSWIQDARYNLCCESVEIEIPSIIFFSPNERPSQKKIAVTKRKENSSASKTFTLDRIL